MATRAEIIDVGGEAQAHLRAATAHQRRGEASDAVRAYLAAGSAFLHADTDAANARRAFDAAAALDPNNLDAVFQLGRIDVIEGRAADALAKFQQVIDRARHPHVPALFEAGCIYQELGRYDRAILTFRKVLDHDRTHVQAIVNVGRHLQAMGMRPEALGYYVRAAETAYEAGQVGTCRQLLGLVLSIDPLHARGRTMLLDLNEAKQAGARSHPEAKPQAPRVDAIANVPVAQPKIPTEFDASPTSVTSAGEALRLDVEALAAEKGRLEVELATLRVRKESALIELAEIVRASQRRPDVPESPKPPKSPKPRTAAKKRTARPAKAPRTP